MTTLAVLYVAMSLALGIALWSMRRFEQERAKLYQARLDFETARERLEFLAVCLEASRRVEQIEQEQQVDLSGEATELWARTYDRRN